MAGFLPLVLTLVVVWPVHDNPFRLDDLLLLYARANYGVIDLLLTPHGGHSLLTSNLVYVALEALFGPTSRDWFPFMIATHLLNVWLLFRVVVTYTSSAALAAVCACLWGTAPVHHEALGWFTVYGQVLVTTCVLWVLLDAARIGAGIRVLGRSMALRWVLRFLAAATSFGTGIGLAMVSGAAVALLLPQGRSRRRAMCSLLPLIVVVPLSYLGQHYLYESLVDHVVLHGMRESVSNTGLSVSMPALVEMAECVGDLLAYGSASLTFGPLLAFRRPNVFVGPLAGATVPDVMAAVRVAGVVMLVLIAVAAAFASRARRHVLAGTALLACVAYGIVAVWWMVTQRTSVQQLLGFPTGCALVPRYHYTATAFIAILIALAVGQILQRWPVLRTPLIGGLALLIAAASPLAVSGYRGLDKLVVGAAHDKVIAYLDRMIRQSPEDATVYIENRPFNALATRYKDAMLPGWAGIFVIGFPSDNVAGRTVRFCESDTALLNRLRGEPGSRVASLLVSPAEASTNKSACMYELAAPPRRPLAPQQHGAMF